MPVVLAVSAGCASVGAAKMVSENDITVNGTVLHYAKSGSGSPLILLHGSGEDLHIFDVIARRFAEHFTVYAIDSRNHGKSGKTGLYSYDVMSEDVYQFIKAMNLDQPDILGFSDGAINALLLALNHGDAVGKIALLGVNLHPDEFKPEMLDLIKTLYSEDDPLFELMMREPNIELSSLAGIANPTLVAAGENDLFYPELFESIASTIPGAVLIIMGDYNHVSYIVDTDVFYPYAMAFFKP
jgi:pimeloyl-ACP methyl ester carboxylesterase